MSKYILNFIFFFLLAFIPCAAQSGNEEEDIKKVINKLFEGMKNGDSAIVHSVFSEEVTMATAFRDKNGNAVLRREASIDGFLKAVGTPHKEVWHEEVWDLTVSIDGDFAQVWCDYAFYTDDTFSHCGIDAFHLHRSGEGWRIFHLTDTRRKEDCNIPVDIQKKHQRK